MFRDNHYDLAVIEAWKSLMARLRRVLLLRGLSNGRDDTDALIAAATHAGILREPALGLVQDVRKQWNIAVGTEPLTREAAEKAMHNTRDILSTIPVDNPAAEKKHAA